MCREGVDAPPLATFEKDFRREHVSDCALALIRTLQQQHNTSAADLQHWGGRLYDELIPHELSYAFRGDAHSSNLVMYLDPASSWIPWELLWDGDEFLFFPTVCCAIRLQTNSFSWPKTRTGMPGKSRDFSTLCLYGIRI